MVKLIEQPNKKEIECKYIHDNKKKHIYTYTAIQLDQKFCSIIIKCDFSEVNAQHTAC